MRRIVAIIGVAFLLARTPVHAQAPGGRGWQDLSPEERARAWQNYQRYRQLPESKQRTLDQRYQQFQSLPPQERDRVRRNYEQYRGLDPGQRQRFGEQYHRWKNGRH